jgi:hypothetical protein
MSMCRYGFVVTDGHRYVDCCQYVYIYKVHLLSLREVFSLHICTYTYIYIHYIVLYIYICMYV